MVRIILMTWLQPGNTYTMFLPQLNPSECVRRYSALQSVSRFVSSVYLRLLMLPNLEQVVLEFLVELLLLLQS